MNRWFFQLVGLILMFFPPNCTASTFSVLGENKSWDLASGTTLNYLIGIENPSGCSDLLVMWDLNITIRPAAGSTGDIVIDNAYQPSNNYIFEDRSSGFTPPFNGPAKSIDLIGDYDSQFIGFPVPSEGKYLLEMDLHASKDARGLFYIDVAPLETSAFWATSEDAFGDNPHVEAFDNLPFGSTSPVTIGSLLIQNVPEPPSIVLLLISGMCFLSLLLKSSRNCYGGH